MSAAAALTLVVCASGNLLALQAQHDPYAEAQQAFSAKQYRAAARLFAQAPPTLHPDAPLLQAKALVNLDDFVAAEPVLRTYLLASPHSSEALYLLGYVLERENKPRDSLAAFTEAASIKPPQPNDLKLVALDYVLLEDYPDAIHWLKRSLAADPGNAEAWYFLGRAHMQQGNFAEAERAFRRTLALSPSDPKAFDNLGLSLEAQNRSDDALSAYKSAIAAQAGSPKRSVQPLLDLGTLLNARTRSSEAVAPLREAVALTPSCARCHEELARAYLALAQLTSATHEMEQAVLLDPRNPRMHYQLGQIYRRAGLASKADAELKASSDLYGVHSSPPDR